MKGKKVEKVEFGPEIILVREKIWKNREKKNFRENRGIETEKQLVHFFLFRNKASKKLFFFCFKFRNKKREKNETVSRHFLLNLTLVK